MTTKNEFFENYFKEMLDRISEKLEAFGEKGLEEFGTENGHLSSDIMGEIEYLEEQFRKCVIENAQEGYPVIDVYHDSISQERETIKSDRKAALERYKNLEAELNKLTTECSIENDLLQLRDLDTKQDEMIKAWEEYMTLTRLL